MTDLEGPRRGAESQIPGKDTTAPDRVRQYTTRFLPEIIPFPSIQSLRRFAGNCPFPSETAGSREPRHRSAAQGEGMLRAVRPRGLGHEVAQVPAPDAATRGRDDGGRMERMG